MGYRSRIDNIVVEGDLFDLIKNSIYDNCKLLVEKIFRIRVNRSVYMIELQDNEYIRLDIKSRSNTYKIEKENIHYRNLLVKNNINIPKIIRSFYIKNILWQISEWIKGVRIQEVWNSEKMFEKCGELIAKVNSIEDNGCYLHIKDFNKINAIWTSNEEVYCIDVILRSYKDVDSVVIKMFLIFETIDRVNAFIKGYKRFRNPGKIIEILNNTNWKCKGVDIIRHGDI